MTLAADHAARSRARRCSAPRCSCSSCRRATTSRRCSSAGIGSSGTFGTLIADQLSTTLNYPLGAAIAFVMLALFAGRWSSLLRLGMRAAGLLPEHTG